MDNRGLEQISAMVLQDMYCGCHSLLYYRTLTSLQNGQKCAFRFSSCGDAFVGKSDNQISWLSAALVRLQRALHLLHPDLGTLLNVSLWFVGEKTDSLCFYYMLGFIFHLAFNKDSLISL